jgi:hypothetical protein
VPAVCRHPCSELDRGLEPDDHGTGRRWRLDGSGGVGGRDRERAPRENWTRKIPFPLAKVEVAETNKVSSVLVTRIVSPRPLTRCHVSVTALTVTGTSLPTIWAVGVPVLPVGVPGAAAGGACGKRAGGGPWWRKRRCPPAKLESRPEPRARRPPLAARAEHARIWEKNHPGTALRPFRRPDDPSPMGPRALHNPLQRILRFENTL